MTGHKMFKIDEPVYMYVGEDVLYVGGYKYAPATECRVLKYDTHCECANCREILWDINCEIECQNYMKYCKWCGAKIDWTEQEQEDVPF